MTAKLASHLFGAYLQYKDDETEVSSWICYGSPSYDQAFSTQANLGASQADAADSSLKSSAVAAYPSKADSKSGLAPTTNSFSRRKTLSLSEIIPRVKLIVTNDDITKVPERIARKLFSLFDKRSKCMRWFEENTKPGDLAAQKANANHKYVVEVWRNAIMLLKEKMRPDDAQTSTKKDPTGHKDDATVTNMFELLSLETCEDVEKQSPGPQPKVNTNTSSITVTRPIPIIDHMVVLEEEYSFGTCCLLVEMEVAVNSLLLEFFSYSLGGQSLTGACLLANIAIDLLHTQENQLNQDLLSRGANEKALQQWDRRFHATLKRSTGDNALNPVSRMREILAKILRSPRMEITQTIMKLGFKHESKDYFDASIDAQAEIELFSSSSTVHANTDRLALDVNYIHEGEFLRLLTGLYQRRQQVHGPADIPLAVAFALRIEVLAQMICEVQLSNVVQQLRTSAEDSITDTEEYRKRLLSKSQLFQNYNVHFVQEVLHAIPAMLPLAQAERAQLVHHGDHLATFCLTPFTIEQYSIRFSNASMLSYEAMHYRVLAVLANLYNIGKEEGVISQTWSDLESMVEQSEMGLFDRLCYALGVPTKKAFKKLDKGETPSLPAVQLPSYQEGAWPLAAILFGRIADQNSTNDSWSYRTQLVLAADSQSPDGIPPQQVKVDIMGNIRNQDKLAQATNHLSPMSIATILALARRRLAKELQGVHFGFNSVNKACLVLASQLSTIWQDNNWSPHLKKGTAHKMSALEQISKVGFNLCSFIKVADPRCSGKQKQDNEVKDLVAAQLQAMGQVFDEWLAKNGGVGLATPKQQPQHLSTLQPAFLRKVEDIAAKYGLLGEVLTAEQRKGLPRLQETTSLEDLVSTMQVKKAKGKRD